MRMTVKQYEKRAQKVNAVLVAKDRRECALCTKPVAVAHAGASGLCKGHEAAFRRSPEGKAMERDFEGTWRALYLCAMSEYLARNID